MRSKRAVENVSIRHCIATGAILLTITNAISRGIAAIQEREFPTGGASQARSANRYVAGNAIIMIGAMSMLVRIPTGDQTPKERSEMGIVAMAAKMGAPMISETNLLVFPERAFGNAKHNAIEAEAESQKPTA